MVRTVIARHRKRQRLLWAAVLVVFAWCPSYGFDNTRTHPLITQEAASTSIVDATLKNQLGVDGGLKNTVKGQPLIDWLIAGSTDEDIPTCRAKNHFHNPLKDFTQSGVTDLDGGHIFCGPGAFSNVTWGTGFTAPQTNGGVMGDVAK